VKQLEDYCRGRQVGSRSVLAAWRIYPLCISGAYEESRMQDVLKIVRSRLKSSRTSWSNHFFVG
jgi:hypothetical protein